MQLEQDIPPSCRLRVFLHGPLEVWRREASGTWKFVEKDAWGKGRAARSVFKRLLTAPGRRLSRGAIQDDLWPDTENFELADKNVYNAINQIRRVTGKTLVRTMETIYEVADQSLIWVDRDACETLLKEAENRGYTSIQALSLLEQALTLLERGELLEGESGTWVYGLRKKSEDLIRQCRVWLAEAYEAQGKLWQAGEQYRAVVLTDPSDEEALRHWLEMLARHGKRQETLKCYQEMKDFMEAQGFSLSNAIEQLATRIEQHRQEASLRIVDSFIQEIESQQESLFLPNGTTSLWLPNPHNSELVPPFATWPTLLQKDSEELAKAQEISYIFLEGEIMAIALRWKQSPDSIVTLQQLTYDTVRKYDILHRDRSDHDTRVTRRQALQAIATFPIQIYSLTRLISEMRPIPLNEVLPSCAVGIAACRELCRYEPDGLLAVPHLLSAYLPTLENVARQSSSYQSAAACLASQGYLLVNLLAEHYGRFDQMEAAARQARFYGQHAQDVNLEVSALIRLAIKFDYEHCDVKALKTYQEATALPHFTATSPLLQGRVYAGLAGTHAYCSQPSQALSFLSQAKEIYPSDPESDPTYPFAICDGNTLALWEGLTLEHTDSYADAMDAFSRFGSLMPTPGLLECNRAEHLNYAASVAVRQHDLDTAAVYLDAAEEVAWQIQNAIRLAEVRDTLRSMRLLWPNEPKVKTLQERLYERQS